MYTDRKNGRVLLRNGVSMVDSFSLAKKILEGDNGDIENFSVLEDFHSNTYDFLNKTKISNKCEEFFPTPTDQHQHTEAEFEFLYELLINSDRFDDSNEMNERIEIELEFFERTNNILFIIHCVELLAKFKEDGIIWGVGRGSSCASLVFYLLEITDINPLLFNIKFSELSKEM